MREDMAPRSLLLVTLLGVALGVTAGASCDSDPTDFNTNRNLGDGGAPVSSIDAEEEAGTGCPQAEPKQGEGCPAGFFESNTCTFEVGKCHAPNGVDYPDYVNYCCVQNVWVVCGGMSACDTIFDAGVPPAIDAAARDGGTDAIDAATD
jgi:hypothetical protein